MLSLAGFSIAFGAIVLADWINRATTSETLYAIGAFSILAVALVWLISQAKAHGAPDAEGLASRLTRPDKETTMSTIAVPRDEAGVALRFGQVLGKIGHRIQDVAQSAIALVALPVAAGIGLFVMLWINVARESGGAYVDLFPRVADLLRENLA
jgi:hypothetical protein